MAEQADDRLYSVTTLIDLALGRGEGLMTWIANQCSTYAVDHLGSLKAQVDEGDRDGAIRRVRDARWTSTKKAGERGTIVHAVAESLALGVEPVFDEYLAPWVDQYHKFLEEWSPKFLMAEAPVYNLTHRYAGTLDSIVEIEGSPLLMDIKTTDKKPGENRPPWPETSLQVTAYSRAELVGVSPLQQRTYEGKRYYIFDEDESHAPMPEVEGALVLVLSPYDYVLVGCNIGDEQWQTFRHVIGIASWRLHRSRDLYGPPINTRGAAKR